MYSKNSYGVKGGVGMAGLYEDLLKDMEEIIGMEAGKIELEEIPNMPAKTYAPKVLREENAVWQVSK